MDIPSVPGRTYKNKGWDGWGDFLGTGNTYRIDWRPFEEAREFVRSLGLKSYKEYNAWTKTAERPKDIPVSPPLTYKNKGWVSMSDWLGTANTYKIDWRPFEEAREFARSLDLKGEKEYRQWAKTDARPLDIPSAPRNVYKNNGWVSMGDWLGT